MNLLHLKYAVAVAETNSMTKAAEKLYTAQPNLSRAIRELEHSLGIVIFRRTSKGISPTPQGEEFLAIARKVVAQMNKLETLYRGEGNQSQSFSVSAPHAGYISCAFTEFVKNHSFPADFGLFYSEADATRTIDSVADGDCKLGILRYQPAHERPLNEALEEKELVSEPLYEFSRLLLLAASHPLATRQRVALADLTPYAEIADDDPFVPAPSPRRREPAGGEDSRLRLFERAGQMDLLSQLPNTYIWSSPLPGRLLDAFSLTQRRCADDAVQYRDALIYKKDCLLSDADRAFLHEIAEITRQLSGSFS